MFCLFLLLSTLCLFTHAADPEPAKCCTDHQFMVTLGFLGGRAYPLTGNIDSFDGYIQMAYDYYRKKVGMETHLRQPDGTEKIIQTLMDYNRNEQYMYQDGACTITKIEDPMWDPCLPANATYLGMGRFGFGAETLSMDSWMFHRMEKQGEVLYKLSFTRPGCVPILATYYGPKDNAAENMVLEYSGFTPGISNSSWLDTPDSTQCTFVSYQDPNQVVGRRSLFGLPL